MIIILLIITVTTVIIITKQSLSENIEYNCIEGDKVEGGFFSAAIWIA